MNSAGCKCYFYFLHVKSLEKYPQSLTVLKKSRKYIENVHKLLKYD